MHAAVVRSLESAGPGRLRLLQHWGKDNFLPVFNQDVLAAKREIVIVSPFVRKRRVHQMTQQLKIQTHKNVRAVVVTRPKDDFAEKDHESLQNTLNLLTSNGVAVVHKSNIHHEFAIMD